MNFSVIVNELKVEASPQSMLDDLLSSIQVEDYKKFNPESYNRIVLFSDETCELVLCCWGADHKTEAHMHDGRKCWFRCVEGKLSEQRGSGDFITYSSGEWGNIDDSCGPHKMCNLSGENTVSLHFYKDI